MNEQKMINGVPVDRLFDTIEAVKQNPGLGEFHFRAKSRWVNGGHYMSEIKDFYGAGEEDTTRKKPFILHGDEPDILLGKNKGPNPVEFVLHGLAGCLSTTFIYYAAAQGIKIDEVEFELEGDLDIRGFLGLSKNVRPGYQGIRVIYKVKSDASEEKLNELCKLAQLRSPVFNTLESPVPVDVKLEKNMAVMA